MEDYEVKKGLMGHKVLYNCPACFVPLTSALEKAGTNDTCPDCQKPHVIPGAKEKRELQQSTAAIQRQKLEEAERRKAAEARKQAQKQVTKVAAATASQPSPVAPAVSKKSAVRRRRFGDGILDSAFTLARGVSVIVIVVSLVILVVILGLYASAYNDFRPIKSTPVTMPTATDFNTYVKSLSQPSPGSSEASGTGNATYLSSVDRLLKKHRLVGDDFRYELLKKQIELIEGEISLSEFSTFLAELDRFVGRQQNKLTAADWFCSEFSSNYAAREEERRWDERHNAELSGRLSMLATSAVAIFGGLVSFLILPLLIRIETNTRELGLQ